jgi:hypothetical protein
MGRIPADPDVHAIFTILVDSLSHIGDVLDDAASNIRDPS